MTAPPRRGCRRFILGFLAFLLLLAAGLYFTLNSPRPSGPSGPEADRLAKRLEATSHPEAWQRTGAIRWDFAGRQQHLWDRQRQLARVRWDDVEVLLRLDDQQGVVRRAGEQLPADQAAPYLEEAWAHWCNDSFWLNPLAKLFDEGTRRSLVELDDGGQGLLVEYTDGGVTPGDAYLWLVDADGQPVAWKMWTSILPIQGVRASWEGWIELATGARVASRHKIYFFTLELRDIEAAADVESLEGEDPFLPLLEG